MYTVPVAREPGFSTISTYLGRHDNCACGDEWVHVCVCGWVGTCVFVCVCVCVCLHVCTHVQGVRVQTAQSKHTPSGENTLTQHISEPLKPHRHSHNTPHHERRVVANTCSTVRAQGSKLSPSVH